jgi:hypothetical protein
MNNQNFLFGKIKSLDRNPLQYAAGTSFIIESCIIDKNMNEYLILESSAYMTIDKSLRSPILGKIFDEACINDEVKFKFINYKNNKIITEVDLLKTKNKIWY